MTILDAIILGLVEGITEFLPISSTGHLILVSSLRGLDANKESVDAFNIIIQGGAILAVAGVFWPRVLAMILGLLGRNRAGLKLFINLTIAFLPAAFIGVMINDWVEAVLFHPVPVMGALFVGGVVLILMRKWQRRLFHEARDPEHPDARAFVDIEHLSWRRALIIGLLQVLSMWPGTSRSMMTIIGGMLVGLKPRQAAEFSFLLGLPTLGGACVYKAYTSFFVSDSNVIEDLGWLPVVIGILVSLVSAAIAVKWLLGFLNKHGLALFGWYRIALCALLAALMIAKVIDFTA